MPIIGDMAKKVYSMIMGRARFPGSAAYWERRYSLGDTSGVGSYGKFAHFKAEVINAFVAEQAISSVVEFGCGDGNQLKFASYSRYLGVDISEAAIAICKEAFASDRSKSFKTMQEYAGETADLALSLDVLYHLVEDEVFARYIKLLFAASKRYVIIYSSDTDDNSGYEGTHVFHRKITSYIEQNVSGWVLVRHVPNRYPYTGDYKTGSFADFYVYAKSK